MTIKFNNVYVKDTSLVAGLVEGRSDYAKYFDKMYNTYYLNKSLEMSEVIMQQDSIDILLKKCNLIRDNIDIVIGGDLQNQITASCYAMRKYYRSFLGVYSACATSMEEIIIGSTFIDKGLDNILCVTSSHNLAQEKQFRNPIEYGSSKPNTLSFTATGAASILLSSEKSNVKVTSGTIGKVIDMGIRDASNMGAVMAPAAAYTIYNHIKSMGERVSDYDLILTGDLGVYGKEILKDYMKEEFNITLGDNYNDCGSMLYDLNKEKDIIAGGSGSVCSALINYGYVFNLLKSKKVKKVLLVTTGALFSPTYVYQKNSLLGIAHAVCLEVC